MLQAIGSNIPIGFVRPPGHVAVESAATVHPPGGGDDHTQPASTPLDDAGARSTATGEDDEPGGPSQSPGKNLTEEEQQHVAKLKTRDREVRAHEMAHKAAAGQYGGSVSYDYQAGPDGNRYAVGGEVSIDASAVPGDPEATIQKMRIIARAALAPAEPSGQDRAVAAQAQQAAAQAKRDLLTDQFSAGQDKTKGEEQFDAAPMVGKTIDTTV